MAYILPSMITIDVLIIGAGAAGLMCAIEAGKRGRAVCLIDHANKPGKKILMSGGGRCNFTNYGVSHENYISRNPQFCRSALSRYKPQHFIDLVKKHQIPFHEKKLGQLFCDNKSKDILNMLLAECDAANVSIQLNTNVLSIVRNADDRFIIQTNQGVFDAQSLVIATGGLSIPTMGATPLGYQIAQQFGINVWPTRAGLVPFTLHSADKERFASLPGTSLSCRVRCHQQSFYEDMLFTHRGLSGPAMLQISSYWQPGDSLITNLLPDIDLYDLFLKEKAADPRRTLKQCLGPFLSKKMLSVWLEDKNAYALQQYSNKQLKEIAASFQQWQIKPNATEGYRTAEVTLGGVDCDAISSKTFESKSTPGLYFVGEVLDVTGWLGGYNFQWAWASGHAAGAVA